MARSTWTTQKKSGGSWGADGTIYRPNDDLSITKSSTQRALQLVDGSNAFLGPSTKYLDGTLSLVWYWDDGTLFDTPLFFDEERNVSTTAPNYFVLDTSQDWIDWLQGEEGWTVPWIVQFQAQEEAARDRR